MRGEKDLLDAANLFDAHALHDNDRVGQLLHFGVIVRDEHNRDGKTALEAFEGVAQAFTHGGIEGVEGFIEQQQAWFSCQCTRQGHALLLTTGEFARITPRQVLQFKGGQQIANTRFVRRAQAFDARPERRSRQGEADVLFDGEVREKSVTLGDIANVSRLGRQVNFCPAVEEDLPVYGDRAMIGAMQTRQAFQCEAFARA